MCPYCLKVGERSTLLVTRLSGLTEILTHNIIHVISFYTQDLKFYTPDGINFLTKIILRQNLFCVGSQNCLTLLSLQHMQSFFFCVCKMSSQVEAA